MIDNSLLSLLAECESQVGRVELENALRALLDRPSVVDSSTLTVVANAGVHHMPESLARGTVYILSEGSLDFSTKETASAEFERCLSGLVKILKSNSWKRIYLIPFGPTLLSALAKLLVFRVTGLETIDVMHVRGSYIDIDIDVRRLILDSGTS
jgi:hypothetical protein